MAAYTNRNGTDDSDVLTYNSSNKEYHAGKGNDTIKITGGSGIVVYADGGSNTISVTGGSGHKVKIAANNADSDKINGGDKLTVNGANQVEGYLGSGKDEITLLTTDGKTSAGALSQIHGGAWGDTFTVGNGTKGYQLYGDAGDDVFTITAGNNIICWGGAANDSFYVTGGTGIKLRGGDSDDIYDIKTAEVDMQLGYGRDIVYVNSGDNQVIKANLGINTINLMAGAGHVIVADIDQAASRKQGYTEEQLKNGQGVGYGVDNVYIDSANQITAHLGDGRDYVQLQDTENSKIYTEGWTDTININEGTCSCNIDSGDGDDLITIKGGRSNIIYAGAGNDKITITGGTGSKIFGQAGNDQFYLGANAGKIFLEGGQGQDSFEVLGGSGSVNGDEDNDYILVKGGQNSIYGGAGNDVIEIFGGTGEINGGQGTDEIYFSSSERLTLISDSSSGDYIWINWDKLIKGTNVIRNDGKVPGTGRKDHILLYGASLSYKNFAMGITASDNGTIMLSDGNKNLFIRDFNNNYLNELGFQNSSLMTQDKSVRVMLDNVWATKPLGSYAVENLVTNTAGLEVATPFKEANLSSLIKASIVR